MTPKEHVCRIVGLAVPQTSLDEARQSQNALIRLRIRAGKWLRKNLGFFRFLKKNLKIFKSPDFRFFGFHYFCPIFSKNIYLFSHFSRNLWVLL